MSLNPTQRSGFTLIELLIVVAIIAILAAIAVPNFLEAQTRAKVSRSKADMRTLALGLESYRIDNNDYPINQHSYSHLPWGSPIPYGLNPIDHRRGRTVAACLWRLTTPVSYISSISGFASPFWPNQQYFDWTMTPTGPTSSYFDVGPTYLFGACNTSTRHLPTVALAEDNPVWLSSGMMTRSHSWFIYGPGPADLYDRSGTFWIRLTDQPYDPSNGTVSQGQIVRTGP